MLRERWGSLVWFCLMGRIRNTLGALTPGFKVACDVKTVILILPTRRTATPNLKELLALRTGVPDQLI